jgi:two-component system, cell cycle sensor histidine kinase and response regulator CckA
MELNVKEIRQEKSPCESDAACSAALIGQVFRHLPLALLANLVLSLLLVVVLWHEISSKRLIIWLFLLWVLTFARFWHYLKFRAVDEFPLKSWMILLSLGILATGAIWGAAGLFLFAEHSFPHQLFLAFVLGGLVAGATTSMAGLPSIFRIFVLLLILPIVARFFLLGGGIYLAMGTMLLIYVGMCSVMSSFVYRMLLASFRLSQENRAEIEERTKAEIELIRYKNQLEDTIKSRTADLQEEIRVRKQVEAELTLSNERYYQITSNLPGLVYQFMRHVDGSYSIPYISDGIQEMLGVRAEEALRDVGTIVKLIHPEDCPALERSLEVSAETFSPYDCEFRALIGGKVIWFSAKAQPKRSGDGDTLWDGILFDITVHKEMEAEKANLEAQLRQAHKTEAIGILAGGIAHDFNNLLAAILGNITLALRDKELNAKAQKLLFAAEKASLRAKDLTQQLLTFAKGGAPVKQKSSLENVIVDSASFVLQGGPVACRYSFPADLWLVDVDKGQISQVIQNIVLNASQEMPQGGIIQVRCENYTHDGKGFLALNQGEDYVKIAIQDQGGGIPPAIIEKIFDPYYSTKPSGNGLGLAITKSIVDKHDGFINVESSLGEGSTFTIFLPAAGDVSADDPSLSVPVDRASQAEQARIMVMDDEEMVSSIARDMLVSLGHEVMVTREGNEAINLYAEYYDQGQPFDLILMDLTVPGGMGGKDAVLKILEIDSGARVVVSSGYSNDPVMAHYRDYGFVAAIVKPYQFAELNEVINRCLNA